MIVYLTYFHANSGYQGAPPVEVGNSATRDVMAISTIATMHIQR